MPAMPAIVKSPHSAVSADVHPVVFAPLTVVMNTFARTTTPMVKLMMPIMKLAIYLFTSLGVLLSGVD